MGLKEMQYNFYSFFTKYSLLEDYGFTSGLFKRIFRKVLPDVPRDNAIEYLLAESDYTVDQVLDLLDFGSIHTGKISDELNLSIKALGAKIVAFGLDNDIVTNFSFLDIDFEPFEALLEHINNLQKIEPKELSTLSGTLEKVKALIVLIRKNKNEIGTNLHLTVTTRRISEYIARMEELLLLKSNINSRKHWKEIFDNYLIYYRSKNSISRFVIRHIDLVALEVVEHTSSKGEQYISQSKQEYWKFFRRSLLGGAIISVFALIKILLDQFALSQLGNAFFYSINYASCFILVKQFGGIIATKQPAVTASTIAKGIDSNDRLEIDSINSIIELIRKVSRSQFISIIGNFLMAILFACFIALIFDLLSFDQVLESIEPKYLIAKTTPSISLVFFATIAGIFLALAGLISGYIDNKVVASNIAYRIINSKRFLRSTALADYVQKKAGALIGNICLGFLLGSAFLLSYILPFAIDIRHIAFSSANVGYSMMTYDFDYQIVAFAISGALLIGLVNFLVSFSITLSLALKSRGASLGILPKLMWSILKDFIKRPLSYFIFRNDKVIKEK